MAYSVVSQAELKRMAEPRQRKGYSVISGPASLNTAGGIAARNKQAAKARAKLMAKRPLKSFSSDGPGGAGKRYARLGMGGGRARGDDAGAGEAQHWSRQKRRPAGTPAGGQFSK